MRLDLVVIPRLMRAMTMSFRTEIPNLLRGLTPRDRMRFTLEEKSTQLTVVALHKETSR